MSATAQLKPAPLPRYARLDAALAEGAGVVLLAVADAALVYGSYAAATLVRESWLTRFDWFAARGELVAVETYLLFLPIYLLIFAVSGLYTRRTASMEESVITLRACFYATVCALVLASVAHLSQLFSRTVIAMAACLAAAAVPAGRYALKRLLAKWPEWQRPVVLLGVNPNGLRAAADLAADPATGYRVKAIFSETPAVAEWPVWRVASLDEAIALSRERGIRSFILCEDPSNRETFLRRFSLLEEFAKEVRIAAADQSLHTWRIESEVLKSSFLLHYENPLTNPFNRVLKRALDLGAGLLLTVIAAPWMLAIAAVIRVSSGSPILYRQMRLGRGGRRFPLIKFRTMSQDAEEALPRLLASDPEAARQFAAACKLRDDPRVTREGRWLRRSSLDELPQLWNVLRGQMSLVGPRPRPLNEAGRYESEITSYCRVPCGLTGLWQISGRSDLSDQERVRLDLFYVRNWSIWLDVVILARTIGYLLRPRGAY